MAAEPAALHGNRGIALALVVSKNRESWVEPHAIARVVKPYGRNHVAVRRLFNRRELKDAPENGVLAVLARLAGGPDSLKHVCGHLNIAHGASLPPKYPN